MRALHDGVAALESDRCVEDRHVYAQAPVNFPEEVIRRLRR
jgi:hypothetical protein